VYADRILLEMLGFLVNLAKSCFRYSLPSALRKQLHEEQKHENSLGRKTYHWLVEDRSVSGTDCYCGKLVSIYRKYLRRIRPPTLRWRWSQTWLSNKLNFSKCWFCLVRGHLPVGCRAGGSPPLLTERFLGCPWVQNLHV